MNPPNYPSHQQDWLFAGGATPFRQIWRGLIVVLGALVWAPVAWCEQGEGDFARYSQGKYVFEQNCIVCHGPRGDGNGEMAPTLSPRPRSFREGMFKFRTTPFGKMPTNHCEFIMGRMFLIPR